MNDWKLIFHTKAPRGGLCVSRHPYVRFDGGVLVISSNQKDAMGKARVTLNNPYRNSDFSLVTTEGNVPGELLLLIEKNVGGEYFADPAALKKKEGEDQVPEPITPQGEGLEVVVGQPEMPEGAGVPSVVEDGAEEVPEAIIIKRLPEDLFLADRPELERFAKEQGIEKPEDFRNDDLLITEIMEKVELKGDAPSEPAPIEGPPVEEGGTLPPWPMKTPPAEYLERWPDAGNADLARQHVAAGSKG